MTKKSNIFITFLKSFSILMVSSFITIAIQGVFKSDALGTLFGYMVCVAALYGIYRNKIKEDILNFKDDFKKYFLNILIVSAILIALETVIAMLLAKNGILSPNQNFGEKMIRDNPLIMCISSGLFAPLFEELTFRLPYHYSKGKKLTIYIFFSVAFALIHMFGVSTPIEIVYIIPYLLLSFGIGYGFYKSGNVLMSTIIHILNNILAIMIILL